MVTPLRPIAKSLDDIVARRVEHLTGYQNAAYARRYEEMVRRVAEIERKQTPGLSGLAEAVARYYAKLLAYKDEYEVARLYADPKFVQALRRQFEGDYRLEFNLAPPLIADRDPETGQLQKRTFGPWMLGVFRWLARLKFVRGTWFDVFGRTAERKRERQLIADYEALIAELVERLTPETHALAVELASVPEHIRGFGHVKDAHHAEAKAHEAELLALFRRSFSAAKAAE